MSPSPLRGRFTWHELMTNNTERAMDFYGEVAGWTTEGWDQNPTYTMWMGSEGPIGGLMELTGEAAAMGAPPSWLHYIGTPDIVETVRDAVLLGGRVIKDITAVPSVGRFAVLADPQGAVFAVLEPDNPMPAKDEADDGEFCWHELMTTDAGAAFRFYQHLFGWQKTDSMDMGPAGIYQMYGWPGLSLGGFYNRPANVTAPPHWLGYVMVPDARTSATVIKRRGGTIVTGPMELPGGGWITMALDPEGVPFATHSRPAAKPAAAKKAAAPKAAKKSAKPKAAKRAKSAKSAKSAKKAKPAKRTKSAKRAKTTKKKRSR